MIRVHKVGRAASRNKEGMSLRFEMTNLRWEMQRREESGMTSNFPVGETTWMAAPLLNITERSEDVGESRKKGKMLSSVFFILSLRRLWNLQ